MRHKGYEERVELVKYLASEEGLNDRLISEIIGCNRVTVTRIRNKHNISTCKLENRKDKTFTCVICKKKESVRRNESRKLICDECNKKIKNEILEGKRGGDINGEIRTFI